MSDILPATSILEIEMEEPQIIQIGSYSPSSACNAKVLDSDGICPTLLDHKGAEPAILSPIRTDEQRQLRKQGIDTFGGRQMLPRTDGVSNTIATVQKDNLLREQVIGSMQSNAMRGSIDGVSPCLTEAMGMGGGQIPMVTERMSRKDDVTFKEMPDGNIHAFRAHDPRKSTAPEWQITNENNVHPTITSSHEPKVLQEYRIRKLTPTECLRLMGVDAPDIEKMKSAKLTQTLKSGKVKERPMPKTQLYKMAGNSIVVDVLYHLFRQMFIAEPPKPRPIQKSLFDNL